MLTGSQLKQLQEALLSAFPSLDELRMMVRLELDANLDAVAGGDNLRVVVFKLVTWAESGGRIDALIAGAQSQQPGNPDVKRLVQAARAWDAVTSATTPPGAALLCPAASTPAEIDIFLSYSHLDADLMRPLHADLRAAGYAVWIDDGLEPGTPSWQVAIQEAIRQAHCLVLLMTPNANASTWVNNEVHYATALGKRIFPVHAAGSETESVPLLLFGAQRVDIRRSYTEAVTQKLLPVLQHHLYPGTSPSELLSTSKPSPVEFDWVTIPAGSFLMGSDKQKDSLAYDDELPQHVVTLPTYRIARTPVTNAQYQVFVQATKHVPPYHWEDGRIPEGKGNHPVVNIRWRDAVAFCAWASVVTGTTIRLPTEAEWEKASRGVDGRIYPWGDMKPTIEHCNFKVNEDDANEFAGLVHQPTIERCNLKDTTPIDTHPKGDSPYNVQDMSGNVWEWTSTIWVDGYYNHQPDDNLEGDESRTLRGGSFESPSRNIRCACHNYDVYPLNDVGFRVASPTLET